MSSDQDLLQERVVYLRKLVNNLVIQNLVLGHNPKIKPGVPMSNENLIKLKNELEQMVAHEEIENDKAAPKKVGKTPKVHRVIASQNTKESDNE